MNLFWVAESLFLIVWVIAISGSSALLMVVLVSLASSSVCDALAALLLLLIACGSGVKHGRLLHAGWYVDDWCWWALRLAFSGTGLDHQPACRSRGLSKQCRLQECCCQYRFLWSSLKRHAIFTCYRLHGASRPSGTQVIWRWRRHNWLNFVNL